MLNWQWLNKKWRVFGTGLSFTVFGLGGVFLSLVIFPVIHVFSSGKARAQRRCRYVVHLAFRGFLWLMSSLGVMTWQLRHAERLCGSGGRLIAPNHPSLIDVVLIIAQIPNAYCLVKASHWRNPFLFGVMKATGYISNKDASGLIQDCAGLLKQGETLVMFPEGTRSKPNQSLRLQKGAFAIAFKAEVSIVPVLIKVNPPTLLKGSPWYKVPDKRPVFSLDVHVPWVNEGRLDPGKYAGPLLRKETRRLKAYYEKNLLEQEDVMCG